MGAAVSSHVETRLVYGRAWCISFRQLDREESTVNAFRRGRRRVKGRRLCSLLVHDWPSTASTCTCVYRFLRPRRMTQVFADRVLGTSELIRWASELVGRGILRKGFARLLWSLREQVTEGENDPVEMEPAMFEEILERIGVTIPLPGDEKLDSDAPASDGIKPAGDGVYDGSRRASSADLLVVMRLPLEADADTRGSLMLARQAAFPDNGGGNSSVKAVFEFDHAGAPHGLPERVMALSHKIGALSSRARWRLGGLFLLHNRGVGDASSMILEYDKKSKSLCVEALGQTALHLRAIQFVISAVYHVARDFPGASWTGWVECGMSHDEEKMYLLATSNEEQVKDVGFAFPQKRVKCRPSQGIGCYCGAAPATWCPRVERIRSIFYFPGILTSWSRQQSLKYPWLSFLDPPSSKNQIPGSEIVPLTRDSPNDEWRKQRNMCGMQGLDPRGSCTLDPDIFGRVLDATQPCE